MVAAIDPNTRPSSTPEDNSLRRADRGELFGFTCVSVCFQRKKVSRIHRMTFAPALLSVERNIYIYERKEVAQPAG